MTIDTQYFKTKLEQEHSKLEAELKTVGVENPLIPGDWEARPQVENNSTADENEIADSIEHFEENTGILKQLEIQINEVQHALNKMKKGTYGVCEIGAEPIEEDRLEANPSARTCKAHLNEHLAPHLD